MSENSLSTPNVSVDTVVFQFIVDELFVLLIKRASEPFQGHWALPGSYVANGVTVEETMEKCLQKKTGVVLSKLGVLEQLYTFDTLTRDPRGHALTVTYMGLSRNLTPLASKTSENPQFFPISSLPETMAYDHKEIINRALVRLQSKLSYSNAIFALVPKLFTFSQLQSAYEIIMGQTFDKRNFRKKFLSLGLIRATDEYLMEGGAHRPAKLYRFNQQSLEHFSRTFD